MKNCALYFVHQIFEKPVTNVPPGLPLENFTFCPHSVFMYFVYISEQTAIVSLHKKVKVFFCSMLPYTGALVE
jgi:hypothetical protein